MKKPLVSVIIPAYNCEKYIEEAVRSVMAQTYLNWELVVIDDGSSDATAEIVGKIALEDERITLIKNPENVGVAKTRNRGLELSCGDYVALLDGDDIWRSDKLEKQIDIMSRENAELSYSAYSIIGADGKRIKKDYIPPRSVTFEDMLCENVIGCSTVVMTGELAKKYRFISDYYHEDYCLWLSILRDGYKAIGSIEPLVDWRLIANSRSFNKKNSAIKRWKIYREYLGYSFIKSAYLFALYAIRGIKKYFI